MPICIRVLHEGKEKCNEYSSESLQTPWLVTVVYGLPADLKNVRTSHLLPSLSANEDPPTQIFSTGVSRDFASLNMCVASVNAHCVSRGALLMAANLLAADHCMTPPSLLHLRISQALNLLMKQTGLFHLCNYTPKIGMIPRN